MSETFYTADDLAAELGCKPRKIREQARLIGGVVNLGGRAGYRFTAEDRKRLIDSMRIKAPVSQRDKRGRKRAA